MCVLSVVMTTFNENLPFLKACIESILNQTYKDFEFVVVIEPNERNEDFLLNIAKSDSRATIIKNEKKIGIAESRNRAIRASMGEYIAIMDSDDYCDVARFEKQLRFLKDNPDISVVGSNMFLVDSNDHVIGQRRYPKLHNDIKRYFLQTMSIANPSVMTRRKDFDEVGFFNAQFPKAEDLELWLRFLVHKKKMYNLQENLVYFRVPNEEVKKRGPKHYKYNYIARKKYSKFIWPFYERFLSLIGYFLISHAPAIVIKSILNHTISNKIKSVEINQ